MKRILSTVTAVALLVIPAACLAGPPRPGGYASGFIGVSGPRNADVTTSDFLGATFNDQVEFDPGINVGGTAGYDFGIIRLEGELSYKRSEIKGITDKSDGFQFRNPDGNLGALAMMVNAFFDLHNATPVTPYWGAGIGFAALHLSDTFGTDTRGGTTERPLLYASDTDTVFAWQAGGGLDIALNRNLSLDLGYRYFATDKASFNGDLATTTSLRLESHTGAVGLRVKF
jgi:opacity protein-like surface antigen